MPLDYSIESSFDIFLNDQVNSPVITTERTAPAETDMASVPMKKSTRKAVMKMTYKAALKLLRHFSRVWRVSKLSMVLLELR